MTYVGHIRSALNRLGLDTQVVTSFQVADAQDRAPIDLSKMRIPPARNVLFRAIDRFPRLRSSALSLGWMVAQGLGEISRRQKLDLVEMEETFGAAWYTQQVTAAPVVVRLHGPWFLNGVALGVPLDGEFRQRDRLERRCIASAVGVTSPSRDVLERVRSRYGLALRDAAVIPNPAPVVPPERRWRLEASDGKTILFVGRFDRHKGGDLVVDAFGLLADALPDAALLFVGPDQGFRDDGGQTHNLLGYLERRLTPAVRSRVHVLGALSAERIEHLRRQALVTVVASRYENFSLALVEALAFGCPTVASDAGGNSEILTRDKTGLSFVLGDASDLAAKLLVLFRHPKRAAELGEAAAADILRRFAPEQVARVTLDYYENIWAPGRSPADRAPCHRVLYRLTGPS